MKFLLTLVILLNIFSCQEKVPAATEQSTQQEMPINKKPTKQVTPTSNGIVFKDGQGNILTESQKDSLVENVNLQVLRRFDNELNNTEYILFEKYEDLRGFVADDVIENLIEEASLMKAGGRGAVINKRVVDQWKDKILPEGPLNMLDGSVRF